MYRDFPGDTRDKNPLANAVDMGSIPWSGRVPHALEQLSPCPIITEPVLPEPENCKLLGLCAT